MALDWSTVRLMLIDDSPETGFIVAEECADLGIGACLVFTSGHAAYSSCASASATPIDLALIDLALPDAPGQVVAQRLRQYPACAQTILVAFSASAALAGAAQAPAPFTAQIAKPIHPVRLVAAVAALVAQRPAPAPPTLTLSPALQAALAPQRQACIGRTRQLLATLPGARLDHTRGTAVALEAIRRTAHTVAGATGNCGFQRLSHAAGALEAYAGALLRGTGAADAAALSHLAAQIDAVHTLAAVMEHEPATWDDAPDQST